MQDDFTEHAEEILNGLNDPLLSLGVYSVPFLTEEEKKPPEFIVEGMIPVGMTFLSGAPKTRKSFFALQCASAVARGAEFFGRKTIKCDVLYFDLEGSKSRTASRAERMSSQIPDNVLISHDCNVKLSDGLVDVIRQTHRIHSHLRLIIIDTYSRARGNYRGGSANAYDQDVAFLEPIQRMAIEENIAVLFVHHDKKGASLVSDSFERLSGTMGISGSADCVMNLVIDGGRKDGRATLEVTPRDAAGSELKLVFDNYYGEWMEVTDPTADIKGNPVCSWIVTHAPEPRKEGVFFSYDEVCRGAYKTVVDKPGETVRDQLIKHKKELFDNCSIAIQTGVQSNGKRGIRVVNVK